MKIVANFGLERKIIKKIRREGNEEENEIAKLGKNILKFVDKLYPGENHKEHWNSFYLLKSAFKDNVERYQGNYLPYFENILEKIEEQERQAWGYHLY